MKKRIIAFCAMLGLIVCLLPIGVQAVTTNFIVLNDTLLPPSERTSPIYIGGVAYAPATVFDSTVTNNVSVGTWYGSDATEGTVTIYRGSVNVKFAINAGLAYVYDPSNPDEGTEYEQRAVIQNGIPYVPFGFTCNALGLKSNYLYTVGLYQYNVLRITNGDEDFTNEEYFLSRIRPYMDDYNGGQPAPPHEEEEDITPDLPTEEETLSSDLVYFAMAVERGSNLSGVLAALSDNGQIKGLFFFAPDLLSDNDDMLRQIVGAGHLVGLIPQGETLEDQLESLDSGNELLEHILRQRAVFVLGEGLGIDTWEELGEAGYIPWSANVSASGEEQSGSEVFQNVMQLVRARSGKIRVLLDDSVSSATVSNILRQLYVGQYEFRIPRETNY